MNSKFKFKRLTPMKYKKLSEDCYFIKLRNNWFNLIDLYNEINLNQSDSSDHTKFTTDEIKKIKSMYNNIIEVETDSSNNLLNDYIEIFESQINELYRNQEEIYAITQSHKNEIEKISKVL